MSIRTLASTALVATSIAIVSSMFSSAQAAVVGGAGTCSNVSFSYIACEGYFEGNSTGNGVGTALTNLATYFGGAWTELSADIGLGSQDGKSGSATTKFSGAGAIAIKAGDSYSLYKIADISSFKWETAGVQLVGQKGNIPDLSHISVYRQEGNTEKVPEPLTIMGTVAALGFGGAFKKQYEQKNKKNQA